MPDARERYFSKVEARGKDDCWPWLASIGSHGYAAFWDGQRVTTGHAFGFRLAGGIVPRGMTLDHTCRNRWCQNPAHWQVVTRGRNVLLGEGRSARNARKTCCKRGHPLSGSNLITGTTKAGRTWRRCRTCYNNARRRKQPCG